MLSVIWLIISTCTFCIYVGIAQKCLNEELKIISMATTSTPAPTLADCTDHNPETSCSFINSPTSATFTLEQEHPVGSILLNNTQDPALTSLLDDVTVTVMSRDGKEVTCSRHVTTREGSTPSVYRSVCQADVWTITLTSPGRIALTGITVCGQWDVMYATCEDAATCGARVAVPWPGHVAQLNVALRWGLTTEVLSDDVHVTFYFFSNEGVLPETIALRRSGGQWRAEMGHGDGCILSAPFSPIFLHSTNTIELHFTSTTTSLWLNSEVVWRGFDRRFRGLTSPSCQRVTAPRFSGISYSHSGIITGGVDFGTNIPRQRWCEHYGVQIQGRSVISRTFTEINDARMACEDRSTRCGGVTGTKIGGYTVKTASGMSVVTDGKEFGMVYCGVCTLNTVPLGQDHVTVAWGSSGASGAGCMDGDVLTNCGDGTSSLLLINLLGGAQVTSVAVFGSADGTSQISSLKVTLLRVGNETPYECGRRGDMKASSSATFFHQTTVIPCDNTLANTIQITTVNRAPLSLRDITVCALKVRIAPASGIVSSGVGTPESLYDRSLTPVVQTQCTGEQRIQLALDKEYPITFVYLYPGATSAFLSSTRVEVRAKDGTVHECTEGVTTREQSTSSSVEGYLVTCDTRHGQLISLTVTEECLSVAEVEVYVVGCGRPSLTMTGIEVFPDVGSIGEGARFHVSCPPGNVISSLMYEFDWVSLFCKDGSLGKVVTCRSVAMVTVPITAVAKGATLAETPAPQLIDGDPATFYTTGETQDPSIKFTLPDSSNSVIAGVKMVVMETTNHREVGDPNVHVEWDSNIQVDSCDSFLSPGDNATYVSYCRGKLNGTSVTISKTGSRQVISGSEVIVLTRPPAKYDGWKPILEGQTEFWVNLEESVLEFLTSHNDFKIRDSISIKFKDTSRTVIFTLKITLSSLKVSLTSCSETSATLALPQHPLRRWSIYKGPSLLLVTCNDLPLFSITEGTDCRLTLQTPIRYIQWDSDIRDTLSELYRVRSVCGTVVGQGCRDYVGTLSRTWTGRECETWSGSDVTEEHFYCRATEATPFLHCQVEGGDGAVVVEACGAEECGTCGTGVGARDDVIVGLGPGSYITVKSGGTRTICLQIRMEVRVGGGRVGMISGRDSEGKVIFGVSYVPTSSTLEVGLGDNKVQITLKDKITPWKVTTVCLVLSSDTLITVVNGEPFEKVLEGKVGELARYDVGRCYPSTVGQNVECNDNYKLGIFWVYGWDERLPDGDVRRMSALERCDYIPTDLLNRATITWNMVCRVSNYHGEGITMEDKYCTEDLRNDFCKYENGRMKFSRLFELEVKLGSLAQAIVYCTAWNYGISASYEGEWCDFTDIRVVESDFIGDISYDDEEIAKTICVKDNNCLGFREFSGDTRTVYRLYQSTSGKSDDPLKTKQKCYFHHLQERCVLSHAATTRIRCGGEAITEDECWKSRCCYDNTGKIKCYRAPSCTGIKEEEGEGRRVFSLVTGTPEAGDGSSTETYHVPARLRPSGVCGDIVTPGNAMATNLFFPDSGETVTLGCSYPSPTETFPFADLYWEVGSAIARKGQFSRGEGGTIQDTLTLNPPYAPGTSVRCVFTWENGASLQRETHLRTYTVRVPFPEVTKDFPASLTVEIQPPGETWGPEGFELKVELDPWPEDLVNVTSQSGTLTLDVVEGKLTHRAVFLGCEARVRLYAKGNDTGKEVARTKILIRQVKWEVPEYLHDNAPTLLCFVYGPDIPVSVEVKGEGVTTRKSTPQKAYEIRWKDKCLSWRYIQSRMEVWECEEASSNSKLYNYERDTKKIRKKNTGNVIGEDTVKIIVTSDIPERNFIIFDLLYNGAIIATISRRPWVVDDTGLVVKGDVIPDTSTWQPTENNIFTFVAPPLSVKFHEGELPSAGPAAVTCSYTFEDGKTYSDSLEGRYFPVRITPAIEAVATEGGAVRLTCTVQDPTEGITLGWYRVMGDSTPESEIKTGEGITITQTVEENSIVTSVVVMAAITTESITGVKFRCRLSEKAYSGFVTIRIIDLTTSLPKKLYWERSSPIQGLIQAQLPPDAPRISPEAVGLTFTGNLPDSYEISKTTLKVSDTNLVTMVLTFKSIQSVEDDGDAHIPSPHLITLTVTIGDLIFTSATRLFILQMDLNKGTRDVVVESGFPVTVTCELQNAFAGDLVSEVMTEVKFRKASFTGTVSPLPTEVGLVWGSAGVSCGEVCGDKACANNDISLRPTQYSGWYIDVEILEGFMKEGGMCETVDGSSSDAVTPHRDDTGCYRGVTMGNCDAAKSGSSRVCVCYGEEVDPTSTEGKVANFVAPSPSYLTDSGYISCWTSIGDQIFRAPNTVRLMISTYTKVPPSEIILKGGQEVEFGCEALSLGPEHNIAAAITYDIEGTLDIFISRPPSLPPVIRVPEREYKAGEPDENDGKEVKCTASYPQVNGTLSTRSMVLRVVETTLTEAGTTAAVVKGQRILIKCTLTSSSSNLRENLRLAFHPRIPYGVNAVERSHFEHKYLNGSDSTVDLLVRLVSYLGDGNPLTNEDILEVTLENVARPFELTIELNNEVEVVLRGNHYTVNNRIVDEYPQYRPPRNDGSNLVLKFRFRPTDKLQIWVDDVPLRQISTSGMGSWGSYSITGATPTYIRILKPFQSISTRRHDDGRTATRTFEINAMTVDSVGYYTCESFTTTTEKLYLIGPPPLNLTIGDLVAEPESRFFPRFRGVPLNVTVEAWYYPLPNTPNVYLRHADTGIYVSVAYRSEVIVNREIKRTTYLVPPPAERSPGINSEEFEVVFEYRDIFISGNTTVAVTAYDHVILMDSPFIATLKGTRITVRCTGQAFPPGFIRPRLFVNDTDVTERWVVKIVYFEEALQTKITFEGVHDFQSDDAVRYSCSAEFRLSSGETITEVSEGSSQVFVVRFAEERMPFAYDGIVGEAVTLTAYVKVPTDITGLTVTWIDKNGKRFSETSSQITETGLTSWFEAANFDLSNHYYTELVLNNEKLNSDIQKPLVRGIEFTEENIYFVPLATHPIRLDIKSVTAPITVEWRLDGQRLSNPESSITGSTFTLYHAQLILFNNNEGGRGIFGEYTAVVMWPDNQQIETTTPINAIELAFIRDLPDDVLAPLNFRLEQTVEVTNPKNVKIDFTWKIYFQAGSFTAKKRETTTKKATSTVRWRNHVTEYWAGNHVTCTVSFTISATNTIILLDSRNSMVHVQDVRLSYGDDGSRIPIVRQDGDLELTCSVVSDGIVDITWRLDDRMGPHNKLPQVVTLGTPSYIVKSDFMKKEEEVFGETIATLKITNANPSNVYSDVTCESSIHGNVLSSIDTAGGSLNVYLIEILLDLPSITFLDITNTYVFLFTTTYVHEDGLSVESAWYYKSLLSPEERFTDGVLRDGVAIMDNFPVTEITEYGISISTSLSVTMEAYNRWTDLGGSIIRAELIFTHSDLTGRKSSRVIPSPSSSSFHPAEQDCLDIVLSKITPVGDEDGTHMVNVTGANIEEGDKLMLAVYRPLLTLSDSPLTIEIFSVGNGPECPLFRVVLGLEVTMTQFLLNSAGGCSTESGIRLSDFTEPGSVTMLRVVRVGSQVHFYNGAVAPETIPLKVVKLSPEAVSPTFTVVSVQQTSESSRHLLRISVCRTERKVFLREYVGIPNSYTVELTWLGANGGLCYDGKLWNEREVQVICRHGDFNYGGHITKAIPTREITAVKNYWLREVECDVEGLTSLYDCSNSWLSWSESKTCSKTAVITCFKSGLSGVRLFSFREGAGSDNDGLLQVRYNEEWRGVCGTFTELEVTAACVTLGRSYGNVIPDPSLYDPPSTSTRGSYWQDGFKCGEAGENEGERNLTRCRGNYWGALSNCDTAIALQCTPRLHCGTCTTEIAKGCFEKTQSIREVMCHEDTKSCFKANTTFYDPTTEITRWNYTLGCLPPGTTGDCTGLEVQIRREHPGREVRSFTCRPCHHNRCNFPPVYAGIMAYRQTFRGFITIMEALLKCMEILMRIIMFDFSLFFEKLDFKINVLDDLWKD